MTNEFIQFMQLEELTRYKLETVHFYAIQLNTNAFPGVKGAGEEGHLFSGSLGVPSPLTGGLQYFSSVLHV